MTGENLVDRPFAVALTDMLEALEWQRLEALDARPQWTTKEACDNCGRPFKAYGNQTQCRRRDCIHALETATERQERARQEEIDQLVALQQCEIEQDAKRPTTADLVPHTPEWLHTDRVVSKTPAVSLDAALSIDQRLSLATAIVERTPGYMREWLDPTFDAAEPALQVWLDGRRLRERIETNDFAGRVQPSFFTRYGTLRRAS